MQLKERKVDFGWHLMGSHSFAEHTFLIETQHRQQQGDLLFMEHMLQYPAFLLDL